VEKVSQFVRSRVYRLQFEVLVPGHSPRHLLYAPIVGMRAMSLERRAVLE